MVSLPALLAQVPVSAAIRRGAANVARTVPTSEAFHRWFGQSRVKDRAGRPLVVYHGTRYPFEVFDPSRSGTNTKTGAPEGTFFFSSDPEAAASYAIEHIYSWGDVKYHEEARVMPVFLRLERPLKVSARGGSWREIPWGTTTRGYTDEIDINSLAAHARALGKDGLIVTNVHDRKKGTGKPGTTYVAFEPTQIKSAIANRGTFDGTDPRITM